MAVKNGTTESTYLAETLIPLVAFGLPLSPVAAGPAAALFNAPPVYTVNAPGRRGAQPAQPAAEPGSSWCTGCSGC